MADLNHSISVEYAREILDYNPETGELRWKWRDDRAKWWNNRYAGTVAGSMSTQGYIKVGIDYKHFRSHRLAWLLVYGYWPTNEIDHINGDKTDNRIANLREATSQENNRNVGLRKDNSTGITGVSWNKQCRKYMAQIQAGGKLIYIGLFDTLEAAATSRAAAEVFYFGEFRRSAA
jgi:hypothetical protein